MLAVTDAAFVFGTIPASPPDPYGTVNLILDEEARRASRPQPQWAKQRERKAKLLATARRLLGESDAAKITIRSVATEAQVSVPTVYNLIGTRHDVLVCAMNDYTLALGRLAASQTAYPGWRTSMG